MVLIYISTLGNPRTSLSKIFQCRYVYQYLNNFVLILKSKIMKKDFLTITPESGGGGYGFSKCRC